MRPPLFLLLLLLIPPFLLLLQLQPAAGMPGEVSLGWKANNLAASVGNLANELAKESMEGREEAASLLKKIRKISGIFGKAASMFGAAFAFVGVLINILDDSDPKHEELLAEFKKMHGAIENLNLKLNGIRDLIKHEHAMTRLNIYLTPLETIITTYKNHVKGTDFGMELINYHTMNKIKDAILGIYFNAEAPSKTLSDVTNGNWHSVAILYSYLQGVLFEGIAAYTTACSLYENSQGVEKENATNICKKKSESLFNNYSNQFDDNFNQVLDSCIDDYKDNIKKMVAAEHQQLCSRTEENEAFAKRISKKISEAYFWVDAVVIVYNDVTGHKYHDFDADYFKLRTCKKNVVVFMDSKPDYRNPHKPRMSNQTVQCSPNSTLDRYLDGYNGHRGPFLVSKSDGIMNPILFNKTWFGFFKYHAQKNYESIKEKTGSLFQSLAVIRTEALMWAEPTDYNGRYFEHRRPGPRGISIIGQLLNSSFYTKCPFAFPIAFDSGNSCQKRHHDGRGLWSNKWNYMGESIDCPSKPCRDAAHCQDVCNVNPIDRVECGWGGISKSHCASRGCCFNDSIPGVKWCFHWKFHKTADKTRYGETCIHTCGQKGGTKYYWCNIELGDNSRWDYCSVDHKHTIYNETCASNCEKKGYSYYWCRKSNSGWDYCSPGKI